MDISIVLAQIWGGYYIVFGSLFLTNGQLEKTIKMTDNESFVIGTGYTTFFLGLVTIVLHKVYITDWRVIITILGWITFLKGIRKIGFPSQIHKMSQKFRKGWWLSGVFMILTGAFLLWKSFVH